MEQDLTNADVYTLKRLRDSGDPHKIEAVRLEIARRLAKPVPAAGAFVIVENAGAK